MIRVVLPYHLRTLAHVGAEVQLGVAVPVYASADAGDSWTPIVSHPHGVLSVEVQTV